MAAPEPAVLSTPFGCLKAALGGPERAGVGIEIARARAALKLHTQYNVAVRQVYLPLELGGEHWFELRYWHEVSRKRRWQRVYSRGHTQLVPSSLPAVQCSRCSMTSRSADSIRPD